MTYKTIAMFANDAMACFDRMVPGVSSLIARKFGVAASIMKCRNETIKVLKRNVRTGCGDSKDIYDEEEADNVINGEVQGKVDVESLWCLTLHTIMEAHTSLHTPITMTGETDKIKVQKMMPLWMIRMDMWRWKKGEKQWKRQQSVHYN